MGATSWGTHICLFYETKEDLLATMVSYFKAGLDNGEFCVWAVSDPVSADDARQALDRAIPDFERQLAAGSIEILPGTDVYLGEGGADPKRITKGWDRRLRDALARGYEGMRISGNAFWVRTEHWKTFCEYEHELDRSLADQPLLVLCTYPLTASRAVDILDVVRAHQFTIAKRNGGWEFLETPELQKAKQDIERLNGELEQRVAERTKQLLDLNEQLTVQIADRRRAEEKLQAAQAEIARVARQSTVGELAASIAHEINQPLAAVVANAEATLRWLATDPPNHDEAEQAVKRIVRDGNRASQVIARIRAMVAKVKPSYVPVDINDAIEEVLALNRSELDKHEVTVSRELGADLPPVSGDRIQLQQVMINLVRNGIDAMQAVDDRPRILRIGSRVSDDGHALVRVEDAGSGLSPDSEKQLFVPFFTTKPQGMGMGLPISRTIVEAHGGKLWASPASPHGSAFQFTLPLAANKVRP